MFEKISEWMNFHSVVMSRYPHPRYLMILSGFLTFLFSLFYIKIISFMLIFEIGDERPFQSFIIQNLNLFWIGMWVLPLLFLLLMSICWDFHSKNIVVNLF